eukprot:gene9835-9994_t
MHAGVEMTSRDVASHVHKVAPYLRPGGGGVTCSGGEALMQPEFVASIFQEAHAMGLTTCLDTTGHGSKQANWDKVLPHTDLVLFCIKHIDPVKYHKLTGMSQVAPLLFTAELQQRGIPYWLRYVLLPGYTDDADDIDNLISFCKQQPTLQGVELLPYHILGRNKWDALGMHYPLEGVHPPTHDQVMEVVEKMEAAGLRVLCDAKQHAKQQHQLAALHAD